MFLKRKKFQKFSNSSIFLGLILLAGIIIMSYGLFGNNHTVLYLGLGITALGSYYGIFWLTILKETASK